MRSSSAVLIAVLKYFIAPSIANCDWVVYAVHTGDKPMRDGPSLHDGPWQKKKKKHILSAHRENA